MNEFCQEDWKDRFFKVLVVGGPYYINQTLNYKQKEHSSSPIKEVTVEPEQQVFPSPVVSNVSVTSHVGASPRTTTLATINLERVIFP